VALVIVAAALIRVAYRVWSADSLFLETPVVDASFFDIWARTLADGRVFQAQTFFKPPLYAYLLSWLYRVGFGMLGVQALQMAVGVVTAVLTLGVGRLAFGSRAGFAGAMVMALLPIFPFFENQLLAESWTGALTMGSLLLILMALEGRAKSTGQAVFLAGLMLGVAAMGRPNLMLPAIAMAAFLWRRTRVNRAVAGPAAWVLLAGLAVGILPATLHNLKYGDFVPVSANLGPNLVAGHSDRADGISAIPVGVLWDDLQLQARQAGAPGPAAASRYLSKQAIGWMVDHPGRTLQLLGKKMLLLVNAREGRNNINPRWMTEEEGVLLMARWWPGTWLLIPFAVVGLVWSTRGAESRRLLIWFLIAAAVAVLPFFVNARFRLPLLPILALFAGAGALFLWDTWRESRRREFVIALAALAVCFGVVNVDWFSLGDDRCLARDHFNQGVSYARAYGDREPHSARAEAAFRRAVELDGADVDHHERLGAFLLMKAQPLLGERAQREAEGDMQGAGRAFTRAMTNLNEAQGHHLRATEIFPRSTRSWLNLGIARMWQGDLQTALSLAHLRAGDQDAARGPALAALSQYREAVSDFQEALRIDPGMRDARQNIPRVVQAVRELPDLDPAITDFKSRIPTE